MRGVDADISSIAPRPVEYRFTTKVLGQPPPHRVFARVLAAGCRTRKFGGSNFPFTAACELGHAGFVIVVTARDRGETYLRLTDYVRHAGLEEQQPRETTLSGERP